jgi:hypothetical protein
MAAILSAVRKTMSMRVPTLEEHVKNFNTSAPDSEARRNAVWGIRECAERKKNIDELIRSGVIPIMVKVINEERSDVRLWALWVIRFVADSETGATMILQEPNAIEGMVSLRSLELRVIMYPDVCKRFMPFENQMLEVRRLNDLLKLYIAGMAKPAAIATLKNLSENNKMSADDRKKAEVLRTFLVGNAPAPSLAESPAEAGEE